jgi:hypothetical protein
MPVSDNQVRYFTEDMLQLVTEKNSPDITLLVFQAIEANKRVQPRYQGLLRQDSGLNMRIAKAIKDLLYLENDVEIKVKPGECSLIKSYTRFKPR